MIGAYAPIASHDPWSRKQVWAQVGHNSYWIAAPHGTGDSCTDRMTSYIDR